MDIRINGVDIVAFPDEFKVTLLDLDDSDSTSRSTTGLLSRDRVAVKRQIELSFGQLTWSQISGLLTQISSVFFDVYYPDPMSGSYLTKTFYVGNRPAPVGYAKNGTIVWEGLSFSWIER